MNNHECQGPQFLFGPVPSRRLGTSLGVDLMPHKTCSLDCVYCECGKTTCLTLRQRDYVPVTSIIKELDDYLSTSPAIDHVTFSGSGEPTLHASIGDIIEFIKTEYPGYRVALLTNSTTFSSRAVRGRVRGADVIVASLDAVSEDVFRRVNRPVAGLTSATVIAGLNALKKEYLGQLWVEIFIVPGMNDTETEFDNLQRVLKDIQPDNIHLNSLDRPGTEDWVRPVDPDRLNELREAISRSDIVPGTTSGVIPHVHLKNRYQTILATLKRRPCTVDDVSRITGVSREEVGDRLDALVRKGEIEKHTMPRGTFYKLKR